MPLTAKLTVKTEATYSASADLGTAELKVPGAALPMAFNNGTANGQGDLLFADRRTIAASGNDDLDLAGGLTDIFGNTLTFVEVASIEIRAAAGNTNNVVLGNAASNQFVGPLGGATHTIALKPGAVFAIGDPGAGWAVTAGSADVLRIANSGAGTSVTYDIVIIGRSA